ncbi:MAG: hypothetical protein A2X86_14905 [Bdellovibrionales bacterium GWA2_49_15]|nr:MAG: hypothetical protein A2X86_14905 [Bdellovibrionales bacterium GWA2_49_15]HAZ13369.1 hypothetical protein [Bdellovibrionales bacterium]
MKAKRYKTIEEFGKDIGVSPERIKISKMKAKLSIAGAKVIRPGVLNSAPQMLHTSIHFSIVALPEFFL